jgi:uncharacterized protein YhhL (DUF1145 family)
MDYCLVLFHARRIVEYSTEILIFGIVCPILYTFTVWPFLATLPTNQRAVKIIFGFSAFMRSVDMFVTRRTLKTRKSDFALHLIHVVSFATFPIKKVAQDDHNRRV